MKQLSVVSRSGYGHTTRQANGIVRGISSVENKHAKAFGARVATAARDLRR